MKQRYLITFILCILLGLGMAMSSDVFDKTQEEKKKQKEAALKAVGQLKKLSSSTHDALGHKPGAEKQASPGEPLDMYMIKLDDLANFNKGDDPKHILLDIKKFIVPVYSGNNLMSSMTMKKGGRNQWQLAGIGGGEIRILEPARFKHASAYRRDQTSYVVILVPAMYLTFLGYDRNNRLYFVPVHPHPEFSFTLHREILAETVLLKLKTSVNKYRKILSGQKR